MQTNRYNTFGPRVGFAYNVFDNSSTVLRGGFGVYYDRTLVGIVEQNAFVNPLINTRVTIDNVAGTNPPFSFSNVTSGSQRRTDILPLALQSTGDPFEVPRTYQYSLGLQRSLFGNSSIEIAYVGTQGHNLLQLVNINQPVAGARATLTQQLRQQGVLTAAQFVPLNGVRPFKGYGNINDRRTTADSNYNSAQATFTKRFSRGFQAGAVYTFSKNITDSTTDRDASDAPQDAYNLEIERAVSRFDRTHVFTLNGLYQIPLFRDRRGALGVILGGFQVSGIYTAQSGTPLTITQAIAGTTPAGSLFQIGDPLGTGSTLRPNLVGNPRGSGTLRDYFNIAAFTPAVSGFGSAGRSLVRGPGINNLDLSVQKLFRITEGTNVEFRAEFFNAFNHTQLLNPAGTVITFRPDPAAPNDFPNRFVVNASDNPNFGVINAAREARVIQFGLKLNY